MVASGACGGGAARRGRTVVFASGAELQSMNPLVTIHPLAKQVQRYVLLTTLARYDTALVPRPYLARAWVWSPDLQALRFRLQSGVRWHDGTPTTARDVVWTLNAARDPATGYPRLNDLAAAAWGTEPAHALCVRGTAGLAVRDCRLPLRYGFVLNRRRPPFDDRRVRLALALALDRAEIVTGYLYGLGEVADGPVPPGVPGYTPTRPLPTSPDSARRLLSGRRIGFELLTVGSGEAALEQMIQARLAAVGFDVTIRQLELSAFLDRVNARRHEFDAAGRGTPGDPGLGYLATPARIAGLTIPPEPAAAQRRFADSLPVVFLYHARGVQGMNRRVRGVRVDRRGELANIAEWWIAP